MLSTVRDVEEMLPGRWRVDYIDSTPSPYAPSVIFETKVQSKANSNQLTSTAMYNILQRLLREYNHNASPTNNVQVHVHLHCQSVTLASRHKFIHIRPLLHIILMLQQHRQNLKRRVKIQHIRTSPALNPSDPYARLQQLATTEINQTVTISTYPILTRQIKMP